MYPAKPSPNEQPPVVAPPPTGIPIPIPIGGGAASGQWSSSLYDCGSDGCGLCCLTCWCPCVTFGRIAEIVDHGATPCGVSGALYALLAYFTGCQWIYSCAYRAKMRAQFGLPVDPCCDCCVHCCCQPCALCQEHRELKARGLDPALGWEVASARRAGAATYAPAVQGMGR